MNAGQRLKGLVVRGNRIGQTIGFPTANLTPGINIPSTLAKGVYAVRVHVRKQWHEGMANVGTRPTLDLHELTVEVHLFDFSGDLYGEEITILFFDKIREEQKFAGLDELKSQLKKDMMKARELIANRDDPDAETK